MAGSHVVSKLIQKPNTCPMTIEPILVAVRNGHVIVVARQVIQTVVIHPQVIFGIPERLVRNPIQRVAFQKLVVAACCQKGCHERKCKR